MRKVIPLLLSLLFIGNTAGEIVVHAPSEIYLGETLTITVKNGSGSPLENCRVYFTLGEVPVRRDTGTDGKSIFKPLATGTVRVEVEYQGYKVSFNVTVISPEQTPTTYPPVGGDGLPIITQTPVALSIIATEIKIFDIKPEITLTFEKTEIVEIFISVHQEISGARIEILKLGARPPEVLVNPPGINYGYFQLNLRNVEKDDVKKMEIKFKIPKSWIEENEIDSNTVKLNRYEGKWIPLETSKVSEGKTEIYYVAKTDTFSVFAITGEIKISTPAPTEPELSPEVSPPPTPSPSPQIPPQPIPTNWIMIGILGIGIVIFSILVVKRKRK
jgi:PGF-pre-PGF domain-containing protein